LGMHLEGGRIRIRNRFDDDPHNDQYEIDPGKIVEGKPQPDYKQRVDIEGMKVKRTLGKGRVRLVQYENKHWQLMVADKPYYVRGIAYHATPVGKSPDDGTLVVHRDWMVADQDNDGKID